MKKNLKLYLSILFSFTLFILTSCGGGGSSAISSLIPVTASMSVPTNNATNVSTNPIIQLSFSAAMNVNSINTANIKLIGPNNVSVAIGAFLPGSGNTMFTFAPNTTLAANTKYTVNVATGATPTNGGFGLITTYAFTFTTGSASTPVAQLTKPLNTGITRVPVMEILFSKLISVPTISTTNVQLTGPSGNVALGPIMPGTVSGAISTINFAPASPLAANTQYTITLSGIQDTSGNSIAPTSFKITTGANITPSLQTVRPTDNSQSISRVNGIQVLFSESMNASTINSNNVQILDPNNNVVPISTIVTGAANTFTFAPSSPLTSTTQYTIRFGTGIQDISGTSLTQTSRYVTTGSTITPTGVMISPVNNQLAVLRSSTISLWFSEAMNPLTVNSTNIQLATVSNPTVTIPIVVSGSGSSYTVTPITTLAANTQYQLTISSGIQDTSGNAVSTLAQVQYFTTGAN